ncbi:MAG: hypothetical protein ACP5RN_10335 [Armatimonadota bacterium]
MKRLRMKKQKIVKPDGRWMYLYTFEEETEPHSPSEQHDARETEPIWGESEKREG